jgi:hypothetical protein
MLMARLGSDAEADAGRVERKVIDVPERKAIGVHTGTVISCRWLCYRRAFAAASLSPERLVLPKHRHAPVKAGERR